MKQYRVSLLKQEFPFINRLPLGTLEPVNVGRIKIEKGDKSLLVKKGNEDSYDWSDGGHYDYTKYFAVTGDNIIELQSAGRSANGSGSHSEWDADTIGEQLFMLNITPDFIVECVKNDTDDNGNGDVSTLWTIFKMKRFDLGVYHQQKIDEAAAVLKAEIAAACA